MDRKKLKDLALNLGDSLYYGVAAGVAERFVNPNWNYTELFEAFAIGTGVGLVVEGINNLYFKNYKYRDNGTKNISESKEQR